MRTARRLLARLRGLFTRGRDEQRLREEFESHIAMATEEGLRSGLRREEAYRQARLAFGGMEGAKEEYRDGRSLRWLESLGADAVFGWRQLKKHRAASASAILSLGLATGGCLAAFRLMDALLWRPLPVKAPEQLYTLARVGFGFDGKVSDFDGWAYPSFLRMQAAVRGRAELIAVSYAERMDLTYRSDAEMEKASVQYVSGRMFASFGLKPAAGRLLSEADDDIPGAHPLAVISNDYWARRFGSEPKVLGQKFQLGERVFEIVGVGPAGFRGTETGVVTDVFLATMMNPAAVRDDATWHRTLLRVRPGTAMETLRQTLQATSRAFEEERARGFTGMRKESIDRFINQRLVVRPAVSGVSGLQQAYRKSLTIIGALVVLVLLIACVNVANLMTGRAAARAREMALRVSIGAGRARLIQMVLVESALVAVLAVGMGAVFAWWAAPFIVGQISAPGNPVRLDLPADARMWGFGAALTLSIMLLFGLMPAVRASGVKPASALKGGAEPHARQRTMHGLIATQVAFSFLVLYVAGLFAATFDHLAKRPLGFAAERVVTLETALRRGQSAAVWEQVAEHLRATPGVEAVALARWPLLGGLAMNSFVSVDGAAPGPVLAYFMNVSPGWIGTMKIRMLEGRDFRQSETTPGSAIVNETFARQYFGERDPLGKVFMRGRNSYEVVGMVKDVPYRNLREAILPVAYVPFQLLDGAGAQQPVREGTFVVRTAGDNAGALAPILRAGIAGARPDFRVTNIHTQRELIEGQMVRERLLAMLALFFAGVAALLAGIGLYGVLDYAVLQRRREIGIRIAIGARSAGIVGLVTRQAFAMVLTGALMGVGLGMVSGRYMETLLYGVQGTDIGMLTIPSVAILAGAMIAAAVPVMRAVRINPIAMLRSE